MRSLFFSTVTPYHCVTGDKHLLKVEDVREYFDP